MYINYVFIKCNIGYKRYGEDKDNNVDTIPVKYGLEKTKMIVIFLLGLSNYIFGINNNYLTNIGENVLFEMLNLGLIIYVFMKKE